jgi:GTP-binding protein EngB required for normal cell division
MERQTLAAVLLLVDASIPPQAADLEVVSWLGNAQVCYFSGFRAVECVTLRQAADLEVVSWLATHM